MARKGIDKKRNPKAAANYGYIAPSKNSVDSLPCFDVGGVAANHAIGEVSSPALKVC